MDVIDKLELQKRGFQKGLYMAEGSYGVVYAGIQIETGLKVAMKKMKRQTEQDAKEGIHFTTIRELKLLSEIRHDNILGLVSVIVYQAEGEYALWLISEHMSTNLAEIIKTSNVITEQTIKQYVYMILKGLEYLHLNWYLHRDLAPSNILVSSTGILKIADFGFTKIFGDDSEMTPEVVTLWYRCPELLFGAKYYGAAVDVWSFGCILAELLIKEAFLPGDQTEINQLATIFAALGTPTEEDWPGLTKLPYYIEFEKRPLMPVEQLELFRHANPEFLDLLGMCLKFCPLKRCTITQALKHKTLKSLIEESTKSELPIQVIEEDSKLYVKIEENFDMEIEKTYANQSNELIEIKLLSQYSHETCLNSKSEKVLSRDKHKCK